MLDCSGASCVLRTVGDSPTKVNDQGVTNVELRDGDQIAAGHTKFQFSVPSGDIVPAPVPTDVESSEDSEAEPAMSLIQLCDYLELEPEVKEVAVECDDVETLISKLAEDAEYEPALRLRAHLLGNHAAVWWTCLCLRGLEPPMALDELGKTALLSAEVWAKEPTDEHRRDAERAAMATGPEGAAGIIAWAAFCSGGDIGHPDYGPVEADPLICGASVTGVLMLAGYEDSETADRRMTEFLSIGSKMQLGEIPLPT